jgi:hypothetical protein
MREAMHVVEAGWKFNDPVLCRGLALEPDAESINCKTPAWAKIKTPLGVK